MKSIAYTPEQHGKNRRSVRRLVVHAVQMRTFAGLLILGFLAVAPSASAETVEYRCGGRVATIVGTAGDDLIVGTSGDDVIVLLDGNDVVNGRSGDDRICGGAGDDRLIGGGGDDLLRGDAGDDVLSGRRGNDRLKGGTGQDRCAGGPSNLSRGRFKGCEQIVPPSQVVRDHCSGVDGRLALIFDIDIDGDGADDIFYEGFLWDDADFEQGHAFGYCLANGRTFGVNKGSMKSTVRPIDLNDDGDLEFVLSDGGANGFIQQFYALDRRSRPKLMRLYGTPDVFVLTAGFGGNLGGCLPKVGSKSVAQHSVVATPGGVEYEGDSLKAVDPDAKIEAVTENYEFGQRRVFSKGVDRVQFETAHEARQFLVEKLAAEGCQ